MNRRMAAFLLMVGRLASIGHGQDVDVELTRGMPPGGPAAVLYASDTNNIGYYILTNHPNDQLTTQLGGSAHSAAELRMHLDALADNGVGIFAQCVFSKQGVGWFWPEHPDHAHRPSGLDAIESNDGLPIEIAIDQCHKRGMKFIAKLRMADRHGGGQKGFVAERKDLWNPDFGDGAMDYTHDEIRNWVFAVVEEILDRFDVDGLEYNYIRWMHTFPKATARASQPIMTQFIRRTRQRLDAEGERRGRRLWLGVRVPQTLEECHALGYDVPTWVHEGLVDYVAPCDFFNTDFNAHYEEFAALTRGSDCLLYPAVHPLLCRENNVALMRPENYRAVVRNLYAAGADGVSTFNYMYHWVRRRHDNYAGPASGYPTALAWLRQMAAPQRFTSLPRHYLFYPLWNDRSTSGFVKRDQMVLERKVGSQGQYRFRIAEDLSSPGIRSELLVTASRSAFGDRLKLAINGTPIRPETIKATWLKGGRREKWGRPLKPCWTYMFSLTSPPAQFGDNHLQAEVTALDEKADGDIIVDELEVTVLPPMPTEPPD